MSIIKKMLDFKKKKPYNKKKTLLKDLYMVDFKIVSRNLKILRERDGRSISCLAKYLHVDEVFIRKIESSPKEMPVDILEKLATLYGISLKDLIKNDLDISIKDGHISGPNKHTSDDFNGIAFIHSLVLDNEELQWAMEGEEDFND